MTERDKMVWPKWKAWLVIEATIPGPHNIQCAGVMTCVGIESSFPTAKLVRETTGKFHRRHLDTRKRQCASQVTTRPSLGAYLPIGRGCKLQ